MRAGGLGGTRRARTAVGEGSPFNPSSLRHIINSIAARAEVKEAPPHRFRHSGAFTYLRSAGACSPSNHFSDMAAGDYDEKLL